MPDWSAFRAHFPVTRKWAFFDHAAVAPLPDPAARAIAEYAQDLVENGIQSIGKYARRVAEVRRLSAQLLHAEPDDVAFVANTTHGIGLIAEGFRWQPGDNVVTAAEEYPSNLYPWMNLRLRGVEMRAVPSRGNRLEFADLAGAIDAHTRVVTISAVEFASGFRNDLAALGSLCRQKGIFFFVDAIQALGVLPINVADLPIDALAADGHKWLLGPEGAGIFYIRREWVDRLHPIGVGWNSVVEALNFDRIDLQFKPHAGRWEGGSHNVAGIVGLGASLELLLETGIDAIAAKVLELTDYLCERAASAGAEIFSSRAPGEKSGIVSLSVPGKPPQDLKRRCEQAGVVVNVRGGRLRLSPHAYNTFEELDRFVGGLG